MSKYLNKLNAGMIICEKYEELDGKIVNIYGVKNKLCLDKDMHVRFSFICNLDFIEFEIPKEESELSFRFYIRTLGGGDSYIMPFIATQMRLKANDEGVITHHLPIVMQIDNLDFPRRGSFAIEVYKYFGRIDPRVEEENKEFYRKPENFINAIMFDVV